MYNTTVSCNRCHVTNENQRSVNNGNSDSIALDCLIIPIQVVFTGAQPAMHHAPAEVSNTGFEEPFYRPADKVM